MKKRIFSLLLVVSFCLSICSTVLAEESTAGSASPDTTYSDVAGHWAEQAIQTWTNAGVVQGSGHLFEPEAALSRAELAAVLVRLLGLTVTQSTNQYVDLSEDAWYREDVLRCSSAGIMSGSGGAFRPDDAVTKEELVVALGRALHLEEKAAGGEVFADYSQASVWARGIINALAAQGVLEGYEGALAPKSTVTRGVLVSMLDQLARKDLLGVPGAYFAGTNTITQWDVNESGITISVALDGYHFSDGVALDIYRDKILDSITFHGLKFNKETQEFQVVAFDYFVENVMGAYGSTGGFFPYLDPANNITVRDRFLGLGYDTEAAKNRSAELLNDYPGVCKGVVETLKEGAQLSVDEKGTLVISCGLESNNGYFKSYTNAVPVVNGGIPLAVYDQLMSLTIPAEAIEEGIAVSTRPDSYFTIQEMKLHVEVWEYVDEQYAGQEGVYAFDRNIDGDDQNASPSSYGQTYYVRKTQGNQLTQTDIRTGGTGGPNGTGDKLLKIVVDVRVGPTQWASSKNMSTFYSNLFRTTADATGYSGNSENTYTPADDPEWLKVENQILAGGKTEEDPYNLSNNRYVINYSGDHRSDVNDPAPMWMFIEVPRVKDFSIDEDMTVYVNLIGGMVGGSGQSVSANGQPAAGQDGRYYFVIKNSEP